MLVFPAYLFDASLALLCIASLTVAGRAVQLRFASDLTGPALVVARAIVVLSILTLICYLLGAVGAFSRWPLTVAFLASGFVAQLSLKPVDQGRQQLSKLPLIPAIVVGLTLLLIFASWLMQVQYALANGLVGTDSFTYHMPFALRFFQTKSLLGFASNDVLFQTYLHPAAGSMFHAVGMVFFGRDLLSPLINIGWLALLIVAGAAIGQRRGVAAASGLAVAVPFVGVNILLGSAGGALVETPSTALFLAGVAMLIWARGSRALIVLCGLAIGLGLAVKFTVAIPAIGVAIGVLVVADRGQRPKALLLYLAATFMTSSLWFIRNLAETGSPLPNVRLPLLPQPQPTPEAPNMGSLSQHLTDSHIMFERLPHALVNAFGTFALPMIAAALITAIILIIWPSGRDWRAAGIIAIIALIGYLFIPYTAGGPPGGFLPALDQTPRYIAPGLSLGLALVPVLLARFVPGRESWLVLPVAVLVAVPALALYVWDLQGPALALFVAAAALFVVWAFAAKVGRASSAVRISSYLLLGVAVIGLGRVYVNAQASGRQFGRDWAVEGPHPARIGVLGTAGQFVQYQWSDDQLENRIEFIGEHGPHGSFSEVKSCPRLRDLINANHYSYVVVAPTRLIWEKRLISNPQLDWVASDPNAKFVKLLTRYFNKAKYTSDGKPQPFRVFRITGRLDPDRCP
ncbi:MAG: hypothetical protein NT122_03955 [Solirubrobacterales bacterium]|nr:hypothetical protein [Solirubrobacterales bacterium]